MIDEKLQQPLLSFPLRKRTRYARRASRARGRSSPTPPKAASDEAPAEAVKAATADAPPAPAMEAPTTGSRALAVEPSQADAPAEAPAVASAEALADTPAEVPSDVPADVPTTTPAESVTEAPKDLPIDTPADAPIEALNAAPADAPAATSAEIPADIPKDLPANTPTDAPVDSSTDSLAEASTPAPTDVPAATPADASTEIPADALTDAATGSSADLSKEVRTDTPTSAQNDSPVASSADVLAEAPKEASADAPGDVTAKVVEAKSAEATKSEPQEADAEAVETLAAMDAEASRSAEEIASEPVKPADDEPEETSKTITETPAEAEALEKAPQDITESAAASEDTKSKEASDEVKDTIPEDASKDLTPEPKILADEMNATEANSAPRVTEAPAVGIPTEAAAGEAQTEGKEVTGAKDDAPLMKTPTDETTETSTSDSHAPIKESLSKDAAVVEPPSDEDTMTNEPQAETLSQEAGNEDASDAKAPVEASPAAPEAISENAAETATDTVPGETTTKEVSVDGAPASTADVASPEATVEDGSKEPISSEEPTAESTSPEVPAHQATQAITGEAATPDVDSSEAVAKDALADGVTASAAAQPEASSPEAAAQDAPAADVPAEASGAKPQESPEKPDEEAVTRDTPDATVVAETSPATPKESTAKVSEAAAATETPDAGLTHASAVAPEEAPEQVEAGASAKDVPKTAPETSAEVASDKASDVDISVLSSMGSPDAEAPFETVPSKVEEASKVIDEVETKDAPVGEIPVETSEKVSEESSTKDSAPVIPEEASDDEAMTRNVSAVETAAETPLDTAQASHEGAEEKITEEPAAEDAPVAESLQATSAEIPQASHDNTASEASPEINDKSATDNKTSTAPAEEKPSNDKMSSEVSPTAEPTAETIRADDPADEKPSDDLPAVPQSEDPEAVQDKTIDAPKTAAVPSLDPPESTTKSREETPAISKAAVSPLAVQEDSGIGQQASTGVTDNDLPPVSPSGSTSQKTTDDQLAASDGPTSAEPLKAADDSAIQSQNMDSDDALSDATEEPNSPRASLDDSDDSHTRESVAESLETLSTATKEGPSQSSVPLETSAVAPGKTLETITGETQPETNIEESSVDRPESQSRNAETASVPDAVTTSDPTPAGTETTIASKPIADDNDDDDDNDLAHLQEESPAQAHQVPKSQSQTAQNLDQEHHEAPVGALEEPGSTVSQPEVGGSSDLDPMAGDSDERVDTESEGQLDTKESSAAPEKQHSGPAAATGPNSDSPAPVSGHVTTAEELAPETAPSGKTEEEASVSEGTASIPSIRLNEEKDDTIAPGTPLENTTAQDTKTSEAAEFAQPSSVESVAEATGLTSASGQGVDLVPSRQSSRSPLPVENTTVDGQEALFDDDSVATDNDEDLAGDKIKESIVSYKPEEDEGPPTARLPVDGITRFRGNEVKSYEHLRGSDDEKMDLDGEQNRHAFSGSPDSASDLGDFAPRDVTNVAWRDRSESVNSFSTMSSTPSSPVQSAVHSDRHDSAVRDAWPASLGAASRSRGYSQLTNNTSVGSTMDEFDPFRYDASSTAAKAGGIPSPPLPQSRDFDQPQEYGQTREMAQAKEATSPRDSPLAPPESQAAASRSSLAGSPMFAKLRGRFEGQPGANSQPDANPPRSGSPTPSRSPSGFFAPVGRERSSSLRKSVNARDESSAQSSLLGANEGASSTGRH